MLIVRLYFSTLDEILTLMRAHFLVESKYMISGAADNTLRLWAVQSGKCLFTWEFPTAVKRVAFNESGSQVVCITEQRMGHQCAIRVFDINREDGASRTHTFFVFYTVSSI